MLRIPLWLGHKCIEEFLACWPVFFFSSFFDIFNDGHRQKCSEKTVLQVQPEMMQELRDDMALFLSLNYTTTLLWQAWPR